MAITVTKTVTGLTILNNADNIVSEVEVTTKSVDDSNPSVLTIEGTDLIKLDTTGITTSTAGFTTFANLTQSQILRQFKNRLNNSKQEEFNTACNEVEKIAGFRIQEIFNS